MERMAVTAATGVMSSLLSKLSSLPNDEYMLGVRRDIEFIIRELTDMNVALVKLADREKLDVQTKIWRDKVREMAYDIDDVIDILMLHHDEAGGDKDGLFRKAARKMNKLRMRYHIAVKIQEIKARVVEQSQSRDRYKVEESISEPRLVEVDPRLPAMYEDAKRLVGIDGPREEIIKQLMEEDDSKPGRFKVQSIVGFGGLGKTTLANQVYAKIRNEFECTAFISVSRTPHMPKILKHILYQVGYVGLEVEDDVGELIGILRAKLTNKRYFVIIDDIWSIKDWDTIKCAFVENNNASRVITTTRIQDIAMACCSSSQGHVYQMPPLNELHSRRLFFKRLFDTEDSCPEQFREISDQMLRKCKGIPLAITSIASLLANKMQVKIWKEIHNSLGSQLDTNPTLQWMRHVLSLGYNDLSHELKTCLLYLGMYPEDHKIPKEALVRKWIAEGFVREKQGLDLEKAAENCFNELINRSMIQPCFNENGSGEVSACEIHALMRDLIILKGIEENFITVIDKKYLMNAASQVRRISHQFHDKDMPQAGESMCASTVRSYIFFPVADCIPPLSKFEHLRVLDMERSFSEAPMCLDLSAINHLFLLRYVRVQNFDIQLPKKFGKLKHLMTLDMSQSWSSSEQISDFSSLSSLGHLKLPGPVTFKNGLSKLCNLSDLSCFDIGSNSMECIRYLGELTNLRSLHVTYSCSREDDIENNPKMQILAASLNKLGNSDLRHLDLFFQTLSSATAPSAQFWSNCLTRPRNLQSLSLHCPLMPKLPNWIAYADTLAHAVLPVQELRSDDVQVLAQLPCLIYLQLRAKTIPENNIIIQPNTFHSLKSFKFFCGVPCLTFEPEAMPRLRMLEIQFDACEQGAMQLQGVIPFSGIKHLASLEEIFFVIHGKSTQWSKIESACRDAISRHPKSQAMKIAISHEEEEMAVALTAIVQRHPSSPNYSLNRVGTCVADKQILCDSSQHSQAVASDVIALELLKQTTSDLPDEQKYGTGDFGIVYKGDHANRRQRLNIGDTTSGLDETENNNMKSVMTSASENDDDNNAGGEDEIKFFGSDQTDFRDQECNADDDTHDGEDNMEFGIEQPTEAMELNILERVVAGSEEPSHLDLSLLQSITENFSMQRKIGVGGCGDVYKGILRNGIVAVKRLFNSRTIKDKMFHREVQSLITIRHKNIVRFLGYCSFTEERVFIFEGRTIMADIRERLLCFEYIRNGNLENYLTDELRGLEWHTRYEIILGICNGLLYLHKDKDIVHMDLKPANILLDDLMVPKITDFGLSRLDNNSQAVTTSRLMSPGYCAPEYFLEGKSSSKSDIYSLGVIIIELVTGSKKEHDLTKVLRKWSHRWNKSSKHTPLGYRQVTTCLELAQRCIKIDPTARPDITYIMDELNTIDSNGGQFQEIPFLDDMLGIEPLEIHFPFELDLQMSHSIELANDTNGYIAFMTKARSHRFRIEPDKGIVPPGSKCGVIITMQAHVNALPNNHHKEEITLLSTRVDGGIDSMDITRDMFIEKEGTVVDEVNVMVVFDKPPSAEEES